MQTETLQLERLVDDPEIRRAAAKTLKGFCLTYLPHHFPADLSDFFDEMAHALEDPDCKRLEIIGFRGCAKSTMASLALVLWAALEHPDRYPFIIMLADPPHQLSDKLHQQRVRPARRLHVRAFAICLECSFEANARDHRASSGLRSVILMQLHFALHAANLILQQPACVLECVVDGKVHVRMAFIACRRSADIDLAPVR
jgi:hypothetical protein